MHGIHTRLCHRIFMNPAGCHFCLHFVICPRMERQTTLFFFKDKPQANISISGDPFCPVSSYGVLGAGCCTTVLLCAVLCLLWPRRPRRSRPQTRGSCCANTRAGSTPKSASTPSTRPCWTALNRVPRRRRSGCSRSRSWWPPASGQRSAWTRCSRGVSCCFVALLRVHCVCLCVFVCLPAN